MSAVGRKPVIDRSVGQVASAYWSEDRIPVGAGVLTFVGLAKFMTFAFTALGSSYFREARPGAFYIANCQRPARELKPASGEAITWRAPTSNHPRHLRFNA